MNNRFITIIIFSLLSNVMVAAVNILDVLDKGGTHFYFPLIDKPVIKCSNGELSIISEKNSYATNLSDVVYYTFIDNTDNKVSTILGQGTFKFMDGHIYVSGQVSNAEIYVYSISGMLVDIMVAKDNLTDIDLSRYPQGQYVITTPTITCKFIKK